jgi:hypothetical protein
LQPRRLSNDVIDDVIDVADIKVEEMEIAESESPEKYTRKLRESSLHDHVRRLNKLKGPIIKMAEVPLEYTNSKNRTDFFHPTQKDRRVASTNRTDGEIGLIFAVHMYAIEAVSATSTQNTTFNALE